MNLVKDEDKLFKSLPQLSAFHVPPLSSHLLKKKYIYTYTYGERESS
jgi:hypothetical protein